MNYLAHAYLSFNNERVLVGNMISDFVKGSTRFRYERLIQEGIMLHRKIDAYTDSHEMTRQVKEIFRPEYRLYSGPIVDIIYDHFLAVDATVFEKDRLLAFTLEVYEVLEKYAAILPARFLYMLPYMKSENWLFNYQFNTGLEKSLAGLIRRATYISDHKPAFMLFEANYEQIRVLYTLFFEDVKKFAKEQYDQLI